MVIELHLIAEDADATSVSTTVDIDVADPRWPAWLVDAVTFQAQEGARRLRDQLAVQRAIPGHASAESRFVPLAAVIPTAEPGR